MIKQAAKGLNSRSEVKLNKLPLITAPMSSVVDDKNYMVYEQLGIETIIPRTSSVPLDHNGWIALSLNEFSQLYNSENLVQDLKDLKPKVLIDCANGNTSLLHDSIKKAKELYGDHITIMAGNVGSVEAFVELAKTGVDYIRVGIGGGGGCHTTRNTGVGQECLETLIRECSSVVDQARILRIGADPRHIYFSGKEEAATISRVKIIADGISSYIKQCQDKYNFNDNGYAAIIKLLHSGADMVMIGRLFAQAEESAGEKREVNKRKSGFEFGRLTEEIRTKKEVLYSGMSTQKEQKGYSKNIKPSEGSTTWLDVKWSLREWLYGRKDQDSYPYLNGFVNSLKSAMSYRGAKTLKEFK